MVYQKKLILPVLVMALLIISGGLIYKVLLNNNTTLLAEEHIKGMSSENTEVSENTVQILEYIVITETPIPTPTPRPTATPSPIPYTSQDLESWFIKYSNLHSVDKELLKKIAYCESKFNPKAVNWIYGGMFQFAPSTWVSLRRTLNLDSNPDLRFNPEEAIKTAAYKLALNGRQAWPNCNK